MQKVDLNSKIINFGADWQEFKKWIDGTYASLLYTWVDNGSSYDVLAEDGSFIRVVGINKVETDNYCIDFETNYKVNKPIEKRQPGNKALLVAPTAREGDEAIVATHNFCDKTTWFTLSVRVISGTLYNSGDNLTFSGSNLFWIDMSHGKMHKEDEWNSGGQYNVEIFVDGIQKTQRLSWDTSGGDFTVNYASGSITFFSEVTGSVTSNHSYADGSQFILCPEAGKKIIIEDAEAQFSTDVEFQSGIEFRIYGPIDIFAPFLLDSNGGPYPSGTKIELPGEGETYKSMAQIIDEARGAYPQIPRIGGKRGMKNAVNGFPFNYATARVLDSTYGLELRVGLTNNENFNGERATATFYTAISDV